MVDDGNLRAQPLQGLRELHAVGAAAYHQQAPGQLTQVPHVLVVVETHQVGAGYSQRLRT